jgi:hypothetical protein
MHKKFIFQKQSLGNFDTTKLSGMEDFEALHRMAMLTGG